MLTKLDSLAVSNKTVFLRTEFNVVLDEENSVVDDLRIKVSLPTINWLRERKARVVICSHLGRPWGEIDPTKSLKHLVKPLSAFLASEVSFSGDCIGSERQKAQNALRQSQVLLLENVRFYKEENENDPKFARDLSEGIDVYINDAFGNSHRPHASMVGLPQLIPEKAPGVLVEQELTAIDSFLENPEHPAVAIIGGAKVTGKDGKIHVIRNLLRTIDVVCIVGKIAYYFLAAIGYPVGRSIDVDKRQIDAPGSDQGEAIEECKAVLREAEKKRTKIVLPVDSKVALYPEHEESFNAEHKNGHFPDDASAFDIGPHTIQKIGEYLSGAKVVVWNGPAGYFEKPRFREGSLELARILKKIDPRILVGGGETLAVLKEVDFSSKNAHICTGGGAMLSMLMGRKLPAIEAIESR